MIATDQAEVIPQQQLDLFEQRLPRRPYCTDDLEAGLRIRDPKRASKARYIQANPPWLRSWLLFDVDRCAGALAWDDAMLPEPAWSAMNPANGHAHLAWGLDAPVLLGQHDRAKPMRYLAAVESSMRARLESDSGYSGLITKNPKHAHWRVMWGRQLYTLSDLEEWLELPKHAPKKKPEQAGIGRNVATFDHVRYAAYPQVRAWKLAGHGAYVYWLQWLYQLALEYTHNEHPTPMDYRECHWIAKSVGHWVWTRFDPEASDARFSALQAHRGRQGKGKNGRPRKTAETKPWEKEGISRAQWYRRRRTQNRSSS
jgi:hypothetical protein